MQVIAKRRLRDCWEKHPFAQTPLETWYDVADRASWSIPADVKAEFGTNVDFVGDSRAIFDIGGNKFRVVAHIAYKHKKVLIKFVGTHKEYDKIDAENVS